MAKFFSRESDLFEIFTRKRSLHQDTAKQQHQADLNPKNKKGKKKVKVHQYLVPKRSSQNDSDFKEIKFRAARVQLSSPDAKDLKNQQIFPNQFVMSAYHTMSSFKGIPLVFNRRRYLMNTFPQAERIFQGDFGASEKNTLFMKRTKERNRRQIRFQLLAKNKRLVEISFY